MYLSLYPALPAFLPPAFLHSRTMMEEAEVELASREREQDALVTDQPSSSPRGEPFEFAAGPSPDGEYLATLSLPFGGEFCVLNTCYACTRALPNTGGPCRACTIMCCPLSCTSRVGNLVVLKESVNSDMERQLDCVVGPFWPVMVCITFPLIIILGTLFAKTALENRGPGW